MLKVILDPMIEGRNRADAGVVQLSRDLAAVFLEVLLDVLCERVCTAGREPHILNGQSALCQAGVVDHNRVAVIGARDARQGLALIDRVALGEVGGLALHLLGFEIDVFNPGYSNINVDVSQSWLQSEYPHLDVSAVNKIEVPHGVSDLYNEHGDVVNNLFTVLQAIAKDLAAKGATEKREIHVFEQPTFVMTGLPMFPRLKINSAAADVSIEHTRETRRAQMSSFGQWIFRNIKFGNTRLFLSTPSVGTWLPTKNQSASYLTREHPLSCSTNFLVDGKDVTIFADITLPSPQPLPLLDAVGKDVEGK